MRTPAGAAGRPTGGGLPRPAEASVGASLAAARLSRRESDDVARELAAHFEDGLARGRALEDLLRDFGDPALAGALIGRGVRRRRRAGRHAWRLLEAFTALVLAAYLVSFARLHARGPEAAGSVDPGSRAATLEAWSVGGTRLAAEAARGRSLLERARRESENGSGRQAVAAVAEAIAVARGIAGDPAPASDLAALRLAEEAATLAASLAPAGPSPLSPQDTARLVSTVGALKEDPIAWRPEKVRAAFERLASRMYTGGGDGRLTSRGLRLYQAWKGKSDPSFAALVLEPAYFASPARRGEAVAELERFLALAGRGLDDPAFERGRSAFEASAWRTLRFAPLQIPLDHIDAARRASRELERALGRAHAAAERRT